MQSQPLPETDLFAYAVADIADAIAGRPGDTKDQRAIRSQIATRLMLGLDPRGAPEMMLAGHTVMFHTLMTDSIRITLQGEIDTMRRGTRAGVIAMNHAFHRNLSKLEERQAQRAEARSVEEPKAQTATPKPTQVAAIPGTANQDPLPVGLAPATDAPAQALTPPSASQIPAECPVPPEPFAADRETEAAGEVDLSASPVAPLEAAPAVNSANENDPPAAAPPKPPQLNRAQRRLLRRGQHSR